MKHKILIVDDSKFTQKLLESTLKAAYNVSLSGDPKQAIALLETEQPDLIISDLKMPTIMEGLGFLRMIALQSHNTPVIVYTADAGAQETVGDVGLSSLTFLQKPVSPADLQARVHEILVS